MGMLRVIWACLGRKWQSYLTTDLYMYLNDCVFLYFLYHNIYIVNETTHNINSPVSITINNNNAITVHLNSHILLTAIMSLATLVH